MSSLYPFQIDGVKAMSKFKHCLNADAPGLGKTRQALGVLAVNDLWPSLVVCSSLARDVWVTEYEKFLEEKYNYDTLPIVTYGSMPLIGQYKAVIVDECHKLKGLASKTGRVNTFGALITLNPKAKQIYLSGTPVVNRPAELINVLRWSKTLKIFGGWQNYVSRYCGYYEDKYGKHYDGATNVEELRRILLSSFMVQRNKDALGDFPGISFNITQIVQKALIDDLRNLKKGKSRAIARLAKARMLTGLSKVSSVIDLVRSKATNGNKAVVFCHHKEVGALLAAGLNADFLNGATPDLLRRHMLGRFADGRKNIIILSLDVASEAISLTNASRCVFTELPLTSTAFEQAYSRLHRIGQTENVEVDVIKSGPVDDFIWRLIERKAELSSALLEREIDYL